MRHLPSVALRLGVALLWPFIPGLAQKTPQDLTRDLTQASLEDLMNVQVTSVSKKEQTLARTGAAIFVLTQEDIHRSGAVNIPEILRIVPGVEVAQIDANLWAITIRGFNDRFSGKVLVLIDGRSVYTPTTSGVNWDQQDVPLEDIERIEVIRGPGGAVWGANAMNGVINIITKSAKATPGGIVTAGTDLVETAQGLAQYGGSIGRRGSYRVFGNYSNVANSLGPDGADLTDGSNLQHGGFRSDWDLSPRDAVTVQGDILRIGEGQTLATLLPGNLADEVTLDDRITVHAANLLARWKRTLSNRSDISLQGYYDRNKRHQEGSSDTRTTLDLDFQHHFAAGSRHDIVWGAGYRVSSDNITPGYFFRYVPPKRTDNLFSTFAQDEIKIANSLWLTVGSKFEHNGYTGFEYEPSARLAWVLTDRQTLWMSASRAIRQPARSDVDLQTAVSTFPLANGGYGLVTKGSADRGAEQLRDFEAGYRAQATRQFSLDIATFTNYYSRLETTEPGNPYFATDSGLPHLVVPLFSDDRAHGHTYGGEIFANWNVTRRWRVSPGYSFIHMTVEGNSDSQDPDAGQVVNDTPKSQFQLRSLLNVTRHVEWDFSLFHVGRLRAGEGAATPAYTRLDTRLGWRIGESIELSVAGQNLLRAHHAEFRDEDGTLHSLMERSAFGKIVWRF